MQSIQVLKPNVTPIGGKKGISLVIVGSSEGSWLTAKILRGHDIHVGPSPDTHNGITMIKKVFQNAREVHFEVTDSSEAPTRMRDDKLLRAAQRSERRARNKRK